jgi:hypothetical protein
MKIYSLLICFLIFNLPASGQGHTFYVSIKGDDTNLGTISKPFKTLERALFVSHEFSGKAVSIQLMGGTYYLAKTIVLNSSEKLPSRLEIKAYDDQKVIISAGRKLNPDWQLFKNGIYKTQLPADVSFERLYVNGMLQNMVRYPNADTTARIFDGTAGDATYYVRVLTWGNPFGGYVHALDESGEGSLHYKITGVDDTDNVELEGGRQSTKPIHWNKKHHFVENVFGELDAPGEWYLDKTLHILYYYPPKETDLYQAEIEVSNLKNSIELLGSQVYPIGNISVKNLHFRHNERTFLDTNEPVAGSDWAIYRGGALLLSGTENCRIENCTFTGLGGNAIMLSGYNTNDTIRNCQADYIGASAVCLISSQKKGLHDTENTYSRQCAILDNIFHHVGQIEKRGTGIYLSGARDTVVQGNKIYHVPGSAIRIENNALHNNQISKNSISDEFREIKNP